ncbi:WcaI family glycosyltransferase [Pedobacter sp. MR22-3]|uniref:WcaI family glycosyltransferase n=1 Tax=Pedobacter sp. MR22-3 TaxID=2994552 RepID=UPI002246E21D|nr:WcaI family glycosyltransferase [Pedobacter sp. MR22-3]MCX2586205.1 WcaI family glycosyltransferase [Pedobacter sp. MR22-3]
MEQINVAKKRILLLGINFSPELTGIGKYSGEMIDWLIKDGYDCTVVTSFPYYPNWSVQKPYSGLFYKKEVNENGDLRVYRCPLYVPSVPTGKKRILHDISFFITSLVMMLYLLFKPKSDYVFCVAPPFHLGFLSAFYCFIKGSKMIYHIQDLQIEAARDLGVIKNQSLFAMMLKMEKFIMKRATYVSTISAGMLAKVALKTDKKILMFPNWVDVDEFHPMNRRAELKQQWGFTAADKIVLYSGSIGEKQGLESLISIASDFQQHASIQFIICGNGPYRNKLQQMATDQKLFNISFLPLQPLHIFNEFLNMSDVHLVLQKKNACDLMMPSKLAGILSSGGLALVTAEQGSTLHKIIREHNMGVVINCEDESLLASTILACCSGDHQTRTLNARAYAMRELNRDVILRRLFLELETGVALKTLLPEVKEIKTELVFSNQN